MLRKFALPALLALTLILAACSGGEDTADDDAIATIVAATLQANQAAEPKLASGSIAGTLIFPSEFLPAMNVVAYSTTSNDWYMATTAEGQSSYQIDDLPVGSYTVVAYTLSEDEGAGYSAFVPCGLSVDCADHSLLTVEVVGGQVTEGVDSHDWYAGPGAFPLNPAKVVTTGSIAGTLSFPSSFIPNMNVVAFEVNSATWVIIYTQNGQSNYQFDNVPPGD